MIRPGITGFAEHDAIAALPIVPVSEFKSACYSAARAVDANVGEVMAADVGHNYHRAAVRIDLHDLWVVCNAVYPVVAFTQPLQGGACDLIFEAAPAFETALRKAWSCCVTPSLAELSRPPGKADSAVLTSAEMDQIRYWKPTTLEQIVFHCWD